MSPSLFELLAVEVPDLGPARDDGTRITESKETHDDDGERASEALGSGDDLLVAYSLLTKVDDETYDDDDVHVRGIGECSDDLHLGRDRFDGSTINTRVDDETYDDSGWTPDLPWS